jgi:hypothetical protein
MNGKRAVIILVSLCVAYLSHEIAMVLRVLLWPTAQYSVPWGFVRFLVLDAAFSIAAYFALAFATGWKIASENLTYMLWGALAGSAIGISFDNVGGTVGPTGAVIRMSTVFYLRWLLVLPSFWLAAWCLKSIRNRSWS